MTIRQTPVSTFTRFSDHAPLHIQFKCNFSAKREETHSNNVSGEEYEFFKWNNEFKGALSAKIVNFCYP
jgi:hypothetical protein